jgi:hypothetical protein
LPLPLSPLSLPYYDIATRMIFSNVLMVVGFNLNTYAYDIKNARVPSSLFNISIPADSILGISPQNVSGVAAGNWVFLKPGAFQSGNHEVSITGKLNGTKSDVSYSLDITDS